MGDWYSWNITYQNKKPVRITVRDALGTHEVQPGSAKWNAILAEANQSVRKSKATSKVQRRKIWRQLNFNEKRNQTCLFRLAQHSLFSCYLLYISKLLWFTYTQKVIVDSF